MPFKGGQPTGPAANQPSVREPPGRSRSAAPPRRAQQPGALLYEPGHRIVHANAAFVAEFGVIPIGMPAAEALVDVPPVVFKIVERVIASGRPVATWLEVRGTRRRLTVAPRSDIETGEVYGVALGLARP
jgi:hypothetical protein